MNVILTGDPFDCYEKGEPASNLSKRYGLSHITIQIANLFGITFCGLMITGDADFGNPSAFRIQDLYTKAI